MPVETQPKNPFAATLALMREMVDEPIQFNPQALDAALPKGEPRLTAGLVGQLQPLLTAQGPEVLKRLTPSIDRICLRLLDEIVFPSLLDDSIGFKDYLGRYIRMIKTPSVAPERSKSELALNGSLPDSIFQYYKEITEDTLGKWGSWDNNAADRRVLGIYIASQAALSFELATGDRLDQVLNFTFKMKSLERAHQAGFLRHEAEDGTQDFVKDNRRLSCALVLSKLARYILEDPGLLLLAADPALFVRTMREIAAPKSSDAVTNALREAGKETAMLREVMRSRSNDASPAPDVTTTPGAGPSDQAPSTASATVPLTTAARRPR